MLENRVLDKKAMENDNSNKKVLIGSRRVGKTYALLLNVFRYSTSSSRDAVYLTHTSSLAKTMSDNLVSICNEYDYPVDVSVMQGRLCYRVNLGESNVYFMTWKAFSESFRHLRIRDAYIDEPNYFSDFNSILEEIRYRSLWAGDDAKIIIAGSSTMNGIALRDISANIAFSRHIAVANNIYSQREIEELKSMMPNDKFRTEILCEFINR